MTEMCNPEEVRNSDSGDDHKASLAHDEEMAISERARARARIHPTREHIMKRLGMRVTSSTV
jgi:hypothetical protein